MRTLRILFLSAAALLSAHRASAQGPRVTVLRLHRAGDTTSIRNAPVTIDHIIEAGLTDSAGKVRVEDLDEGGHIVEALSPGYEALFDQFKVGPNIAQPIEIEMTPVPVRAAVKGQPTDLHFADFDRRRTQGAGTFLTRAQLEKASGRPLANVLKVDIGAFIAAGPKGESFVGLESPANCYSAVVRDGLRIYPYSGASPADLDKIFPEDLAALEFYRRPALVPAALKDSATCGALVIWTRSGNK